MSAPLEVAHVVQHVKFLASCKSLVFKWHILFCITLNTSHTPASQPTHPSTYPPGTSTKFAMKSCDLSQWGVLLQVLANTPPTSRGDRRAASRVLLNTWRRYVYTQRNSRNKDSFLIYTWFRLSTIYNLGMSTIRTKLGQRTRLRSLCGTCCNDVLFTSRSTVSLFNLVTQ
jgi:hypothetical protein